MTQDTEVVSVSVLKHTREEAQGQPHWMEATCLPAPEDMCPNQS